MCAFVFVFPPVQLESQQRHQMAEVQAEARAMADTTEKALEALMIDKRQLTRQAVTLNVRVCPAGVCTHLRSDFLSWVCEFV